MDKDEYEKVLERTGFKAMENIKKIHIDPFTRGKTRLFHAYYQRNKNPFFVWEAFRICRKGNIQIPSWVLDYFDECSQELDGIGGPKPEELIKAFGFKLKSGPRQSPFEEKERLLESVEIWISYHELIESGENPHNAYDEVSRIYKISRTKVIDTIKGNKDSDFPKLMKSPPPK